MTAYLLYNRVTGEIVQTGISYEDAYLQLETEAIGALLGEADIATQYVDVATLTVVDKPARPSQWHQWNWAEYQWVEQITSARTARSVLISNACKAEILSGFSSSALGAAHHYPAKTTDQQNLASSVLDSLLSELPADWMTPFWCADISGVWAFRLHTASQIQQVGQDAKAAILYAMARNEQLQAVIVAATTLTELEAITW